MKTRTVRPAGFTLVELLMVILIIGMLVTLISVAASFAIKAAKRAAIKVELSNLDVAMQKLSSESLGGEYPPCMASAVPTRIAQFDRAVRKRFPRYTGNYASTKTFLQSASAYNTATTSPNVYNLDYMDPAEALVFWLGGLPAIPGSGSTKLTGFSGNATTPFVLTGSRASSLFQFDEQRLTDIDNDGWLEYTPQGINKPQVPPYVYFDAASYSWTGPGYPSYTNTLNPLEWGSAYPYASVPPIGSNPPTKFASPKGFQLISCGLDAEYGGSQYEPAGPGRPSLPPVIPLSGSGETPVLTQGDWDNLVNFVDGVLEDQTGQ